ncbi:hypothetical protein [Thermosipho atlanticus]|uniref:Uncharacterized protein n=1 Tax=Thermosipho atlanticus DSM 15807 TaxID=1123380 RepID=A0A1M5T7R6_9BACT|nr:hypothetical protein [Thermosipho atlanticus]SHH46817.1 hypothetical protein SAMN02745199_1214 [Thermosipho atlanticus DSM 15807]
MKIKKGLMILGVSLILTILILSGCTQIPFSLPIPATNQYILNVGQYGNVPVLFKDVIFDELQGVEVLDRVQIDQLRVDLEIQATGTIIGEVNVTVYASTTEITLNNVSDSLVIATQTFTDTNKVVNVTLDSSQSPILREIIDYFNNGGRIFHFAIFVENIGSSIDEAGVRVTGGLLKGKFIVIQ